MLTDRQTQIINKATALIANQGFSNFTTKNLAAEMGFSEPALYRHFKNKQAILLAIMSKFEYLSEESIISAKPLTGLCKLQAFVLNRLDFFSKNPKLAKVMLYDTDFRTDEILYSKSKNIMQKHMKRLKLAISDAKKLNEININLDEEHVFYIIIGATRLLSTRWIMHNYNFDLKLHGKQLFESIKNMIEKV